MKTSKDDQDNNHVEDENQQNPHNYASSPTIGFKAEPVDTNGIDTNDISSLSNDDIIALSGNKAKAKSSVTTVLAYATREVLKEHLVSFGFIPGTEDFENIHKSGVLGSISIIESRLGGNTSSFMSMLPMLQGAQATAMLKPVIDSINDVSAGVVKVLEGKGFTISEKAVIALMSFSILTGFNAMELTLDKALIVRGNDIKVRVQTIKTHLPEIINQLGKVAPSK